MTNNARAADRILGSLRSAEGKGIARIEDRFDTDIDDLWSALTDPHRLASWLGEVEGDLQLGGEFRARFFASGWEGMGRVEACEPPQRLQVLTKDADNPFEHVIEATLAADGDQTILVWEERRMPLDQLAAYGAGIQVHVEDLAAYLDGRGRCDAAARFGELFPAYQELTPSQPASDQSRRMVAQHRRRARRLRVRRLGRRCRLSSQSVWCSLDRVKSTAARPVEADSAEAGTRHVRCRMDRRRSARLRRIRRLDRPQGFPAYLRVFHPAQKRDGTPVSWAEIAKLNGKTAHAGMQLGAIRGYSEPNPPAQPGVFDVEPRRGSLPSEWRRCSPPRWPATRPPGPMLVCGLGGLGRHTGRRGGSAEVRGARTGLPPSSWPGRRGDREHERLAVSARTVRKPVVAR